MSSRAHRPRRLALALLCPLLAACANDVPQSGAVATDSVAAPSATEAMLAVNGGRIWYRVSGSGSGTPVILLHGGPGFSSYYMKSLERLGSDRPVVRYDQLGGGRSDRTEDTTLFTIPHFVAELDSLRSHLGYDRVHLVGHSWGTILALEYYRAHPEHVASLTLQSAALDIPVWEKNARQLVSTLPDSSQRAIRTAEEQKNYDSPAYQAALGEFYGRYVWRHPVEADLDSTMATVNEGIYNYMQGPSEFTIVGTLKRYDATPFLKDVKVPTLYTVGEYDEANPDIIKRFADLTPGSRYVVIPGAAHITAWDNPDANLKAVRDFLREVDAAPRS